MPTVRVGLGTANCQLQCFKSCWQLVNDETPNTLRKTRRWAHCLFLEMVLAAHPCCES